MFQMPLHRSLVNQTHSLEWRLSIRDYKRPPLEGSGVMPIPFCPKNRQILAIVDWCLIGTQEVSIRPDVIEITWTHLL